ncbi:Serine acetyltransferase [Slackia heliotrinireducens]|uniref:Serine acetyltransferase n=1 Tax=Slackia heliotrinireducens (strain ATCC 29202 / DSM 20476 / NCTC 11029 / RHS 1) TaxID=471855 RepID=C7N155_SLAHD|nr:serine acetyltransferase [Slackia heliotrinireducens]ACV23277.1 serine acetyltransferase [Slackia heliotrinireducens DSM 20476]VEH02441.1 Serine acetyltransferase [Slackia heliotrinireducens]
MFNEKLDDIVTELVKNYDSDLIQFDSPNRHFPSRSAIVGIIKDLRRVLFPRYFGDERPCASGPQYFIGETLTHIEYELHREVREALLFRGGDNLSYHEADAQASQICSDFFYRLPEIQRMLFDDVQAAYDGDPAAQSREEIIYSYPGFFAISVYRIAHVFYELNVPLIPRIMSEYAHSHTGVDINAGADIGRFFFIDHATGVVIGETTKIGEHVKIYQGVTLGAISLRAGQKLAGKKRHPTIEDNVTIYSNASVLGGNTVVGAGSVIAGSTFVTQSVPPNSRVTSSGVEVREPGCANLEVKVPGEK